MEAVSAQDRVSRLLPLKLGLEIQSFFTDSLQFLSVHVNQHRHILVKDVLKLGLVLADDFLQIGIGFCYPKCRS